MAGPRDEEGYFGMTYEHRGYLKRLCDSAVWGILVLENSDCGRRMSRQLKLTIGRGGARNRRSVDGDDAGDPDTAL